MEMLFGWMLLSSSLAMIVLLPLLAEGPPEIPRRGERVPTRSRVGHIPYVVPAQWRDRRR